MVYFSEKIKVDPKELRRQFDEYTYNLLGKYSGKLFPVIIVAIILGSIYDLKLIVPRTVFTLFLRLILITIIIIYLILNRKKKLSIFQYDFFMFLITLSATVVLCIIFAHTKGKDVLIGMAQIIVFLTPIYLPLRKKTILIFLILLIFYLSGYFFFPHALLNLENFIGVLIFTMAVFIACYITEMARFQAFKNSELLKIALKKIEEMAKIDQLTGLYNSGQFWKSFEKLIKTIKPDDSKMALIFIDLDDFKQINDEKGHLEGDKVLRKFGELLKRSVKETDRIYRVGGDEFVILLVNCDRECAEKLTETIQKNLENNKYLESLNLGFSYGIATLQRNDTPRSLFERAEQIMRKVKEEKKGKFNSRKSGSIH